jgi:transposase
VYDLPEAEKHCGCCGKDLRLFDEEISERYEYIPASIKVIEDVRQKYACDCRVKTADKPAQPIEKSTAGASMLAHVIVSKFADHPPLHRQEKMFERQGVRISRQTMGGWMAQSAGLLEILYQCSKLRKRCSHLKWSEPMTPASKCSTRSCRSRRRGASGHIGAMPTIRWLCTTTLRREGVTVRRNSWRDTKDICRPTRIVSTMPLSTSARARRGWVHDAHAPVLL